MDAPIECLDLGVSHPGSLSPHDPRDVSATEWCQYLVALRARAHHFLRRHIQAHEQAELAAVYRVYSLLAGDGSGDASVHHSNWHMWKILVEVAVAKLAETKQANERRGDAVSPRGRAASLAPGSEETSDIARIFTEVMLEQLQSLSPKLRLVAYLRLLGSSLTDVACQLNCSVRQAERYERNIEHHWAEPGPNARKQSTQAEG